MSSSLRGDTQDHLAALPLDHLAEGLLVTGEGIGVRDHRPYPGPHVRQRHERANLAPGGVDLATDDPLEGHASEDDILGVSLDDNGSLLRQAEEDHLAA